MSIYKSAVGKPITTFMVFTAIIVMGLYSLSKMPIDLYPEMDPPYISVVTTYPGASASDIETNVTKILEDALNNVDKLKEITSTTSDNLSLIVLEFDWETDLVEATAEIRDAIDRVYTYLPEDVDQPTIFKFSTSMMPIVFYALTADESFPGIEKILDEKVINRLNRIEGVAQVAMMGQPKRMVYVDVDPNRLEAYNLTLEQLAGTISSENLNMPSGSIKMGLMDYQLRVQGEFDESVELKDLVVGNYGGNPVFLSDVASVKDTLKDKTLDEKVNGTDGLRFFVMKQSGANTVKVARQVQEEVKKLQSDLPSDVKISLIMDTSDFIKSSISNLSETLMYAFLFVILVVLVFLGRWRATFIIVLTIPISLIVSFIYLYMDGGSINVISLTSLSIAIGMVVDDAIVVLENITRHIERGSRPREAAIYATNEVWQSVIITTLVVVAVFFPLTLVGGMTGVMFNQLGWIVTITIITSTIAAITLTPMMSALMLRLRPRTVKGTFYERVFERNLDRLDNFYERSLRFALRFKWGVVIGAVVIFVLSISLMKFVGTDFMPQTDESRITIAGELQTGTRVEETMAVARKIEKIIREEYPEVVAMASSAGADDEGGMFSLFQESGSNIFNIMCRLNFPRDREKDVWTIAGELRERLAQFPELVTYNLETTGGFGGTSNTVDVEIYGYDFNTTNKVAEQIKKAISAVPEAVDVKLSRDPDKPELQVKLDKQKLAVHGLTTAQAAAQVRNRVYGLTASLFREEGDEYDIRLRLEEDYRNSLSDLEQLTLVTAQGNKIKLSEVSKVVEYYGPPSIQHKKRERVLTVSAKPEKVSLGELAEKIEVVMKDVDVPNEVMIRMGGAYKEQQESFADLGLLMMVSLLLVFIVMASQFESFRMPFVIMFSIPFAFTGVILALFLTNTTLSVVAGLGAVLLIGIVVKNGIVLVDFTNLLRDRDVPLNEAIVAAGKSRLRPVLMTALTTILGMVPLALSTGEGSEIWRPMGVSVIGGLIFSTVITMVLIPTMYGIFIKKGETYKRKQLHAQMEGVLSNQISEQSK